MQVTQAGGSVLNIFVPVQHASQVEHYYVLRNKLLSVFSGLTAVDAKGYWVPPKGVVVVEGAKVLVVVSEDPDALKTVIEIAGEYQRNSGEEQVLITRNHADIIYLNKEQS